VKKYTVIGMNFAVALKNAGGQLSSNDLDELEGKTDQLVGKIQQKTGQTRQKIEAELDSIVQKPVEVCLISHREIR